MKKIPTAEDKIKEFLSLSTLSGRQNRDVETKNVCPIAYNVIELKADRLYKRFGDGGLILGCVSGVGRNLSVGSLYLI